MAIYWSYRGVLALIPWTAYLSIVLPPHFRADDWNVAWVGFDCAIMAVLAATAWAAWHQRQILAAMSIIAATMLVCDSWFDVSTSFGTSDQVFTLLNALLVNIPVSMFLLFLARRIMLRTAEVLAAALNSGPVPHHVHEVVMPFVTQIHKSATSTEIKSDPLK
ncbi:MAG: hypothetical protein HKL80_01980 [Acidimicrobiales bacterium]|nr:hypothetical protein [Acidimicrobiales bacterium]